MFGRVQWVQTWETPTRGAHALARVWHRAARQRTASERSPRLGGTRRSGIRNGPGSMMSSGPILLSGMLLRG